MNRIAHGLMAAALLVSVPAMAQGTSSPQPTGHGHSRHAAMHACMVQHLPDIKADFEAHMQQFRASHPNATREERHAERKSFGMQEKASHRSEIEAARTACRSAS